MTICGEPVDVRDGAMLGHGGLSHDVLERDDSEEGCGSLGWGDDGLVEREDVVRLDACGRQEGRDTVQSVLEIRCTRTAIRRRLALLALQFVATACTSTALPDAESGVGMDVAGESSQDGTVPEDQAADAAADVLVDALADVPASGDVTDAMPSSPIAELSAGGYFTCARRINGAVLCWGRNQAGQLGNGTTSNSSTPVAVATLGDAVEITAGSSFACARRRSGAVACWGSNLQGEIGSGTAAMEPTPVAVTGLTDAVEIDSGAGHTCARRARGDVVCWGSSVSGQLGGSTYVPGTNLVIVTGLADAIEISAGGNSSCARRASGQVVCWGFNEQGQLGDGTMNRRPTPVDVTGYGFAAAISVGSQHTCGRRASGAVDCWGANWSGELGDGTTMSRTTFVSVVGLSDAAEIAVAGVPFPPQGHSCARRSGGAVVCWGNNQHGQRGDGTTANGLVPGAAALSSGAVELVAGATHVCARRSTGEVLCWGHNGLGELGDGSTTDRHSPTLVRGL